MFKPGAILKITVKNFVTYTYAELCPGPNLNMLIGPNGTGKSTIVAAIILGLGGTPKTIGRGSNITEYIKHNSEEATIEIKLNGKKHGKTFTISRSFNKQGQNIWKINKEKKNVKEVLAYIREYQIQVDNLCQFLPQDRVADFAKMNKQQLLKQTQLALCREDLMVKQENLIIKRERHRHLIKTIEKYDKSLQTMKDENLRLEGKVGNFKRRKEFASSIRDIERKYIWLQYLDLVDRRDNLKVKKEAAQTELKNCEIAAQPMEKALTNARKVVSNLTAKSIQATEEVKTAGLGVKSKIDKFRKMKQSINQAKLDASDKLKQLEDRDKELQSAQSRLVQLTKDKESLQQDAGEDDQIKEKLQKYTRDIQKQASNNNALDDKKNDLNRARREKMHEVRSMESEIQRIDNVKAKRLEMLRGLDMDAYRGALWLRDNQQMFRGEVYPPIMLEINVINPKHAFYVENAIGFRDKLAFTCTLKEDMNLLLRCLCTEQKLTVNVIHSGEEFNMGHFRPNYPIEQLRRFGFQTYVSNLFTAPEPIMKYLCRNSRLHNIPVAFKRSDANLDEMPKNISMFFQEKSRINISSSKYTRTVSCRQVEIVSDGTLSVSFDQVRLEHLKGVLYNLQTQCNGLDEQIRSVDQTKMEIMQQQAKIKEKIQALRKSREHVETMESRIKIIKNKISQIMNQNETKEDIEKECARKISVIVKQFVPLHKEIQALLKDHSKKMHSYQLERVNLNISRKESVVLENKSRELKLMVTTAEEIFNKHQDDFVEITREAKVVFKKAKDLSDGFSPDDEGFNKFREKYDQFSDNLEELEAELEELQTKMDCLKSSANDEEMKEFEKKNKSIKLLQMDILKGNEELDEINANMNEMLQDWMEPLEKLVEDINIRFHKAFEMMGCAGEVSIYKGEDDKDFEQYGINIKVTYRNDEPLQELNSVTQSGGERAVATATYMLSLQELTPVPFRCVDEINQGMDVNNERRIFELLVDSTSCENTSQYFLITPKLIPKLKYVPTMKIHIVHNGPFVCSQRSWDEVDVPALAK